MAQNIFDVTNDQNNEVHVNGYDWSHQSNFTGRLGYIYPFFSDLVPAKFSFRCSPKLGLQFMPMVFPVQTRMKARVSFFRIPLRALWKDYKDFVGNFRQGLEEPYLDLATSFEKFMGTQKLADYLDIPTVFYGKYGSVTSTSVKFPVGGSYSQVFRPCYFQDNQTAAPSDVNQLANGKFMKYFGGSAPATSVAAYYAAPITFSGSPYGKQMALFDSSVPDYINFLFSVLPAMPPTMTVTAYIVQTDSSSKVTNFSTDVIQVASIGSSGFSEGHFVYSIPMNLTTDFSVELQPNRQNFLVIGMSLQDFDTEDPMAEYENFYGDLLGQSQFSDIVLNFGLDPVENGYVEINRNNSPYFDSTSSSKDRQLKLSAYTARAYEAIYNAYLRDNRNNPYYRNGQVEYNVWIPTDEGGADKTTYELHRANWEKDFLTTAVPSPQQGRAPLVGITTYTDSQVIDGITNTALKMALVDENGKRYAVNMKTNDEGVQGIEYAELPEGTSMSPLSYRSLVDAATTGISIPDLRMVNAYQKFLELNMRKGYSYKQIVEGRFDCQVRYDDLNMPEFIGGFTRDVSMNRVVQSVERNATEDYPEGSYANALGSLAGDAFLAADGPSISCFCDEESIIMGIISIVPVPNYSQLLPKYYLYRDLLDHFQPEFNNLGFQPITYKEVCPIQAFNAGDNLDDVFGYQRPWYEYVQKTDKVHGLFRTQLRNFLMNRVFDVKPALTKSFLLVDDEQLNDVFAVTDTTDKIIGQIWLDCSVKSPVNRVAIPRLD